VRWLLLLLSLAACGQTLTAGACTTDCDCRQDLNAPIKCVGEWACNTNHVCEYGCRDLCASDGGCSTGHCTGSLCSALTCR
jgi:hypothetical protein